MKHILELFYIYQIYLSSFFHIKNPQYLLFMIHSVVDKNILLFILPELFSVVYSLTPHSQCYRQKNVRFVLSYIFSGVALRDDL